VGAGDEIVYKCLPARCVINHLLDRQPAVPGIAVSKVNDGPELHVSTERVLELCAKVVRDAEGVRLLEVWRVVHLAGVALDPVGGVPREARVLSADRKVLEGNRGEAFACESHPADSGRARSGSACLRVDLGY